MSKTARFQTIQFRVTTLFSTIWPIKNILSGATTPDQSRPRSDGNSGILQIPHCSHISGASALDFFVSYNWTLVCGEVLPLCREAGCVFCSPADWATLKREKKVRCGFISFFNVISTFITYLIPKPSLVVVLFNAIATFGGGTI